MKRNIQIAILFLALSCSYSVQSAQAQVNWPDISQSVLVQHDLAPLSQVQMADLTTSLQAYSQDLGITSWYLQVGDQVLETDTSPEPSPMGEFSQLLILLRALDLIQKGDLTLEDSFSVSPDQIKYSGVLSKLPLNKAYQWTTLLQLMIQSKDLDAKNILWQALGGQSGIGETLSDLSIDLGRMSEDRTAMGEGYQVTARQVMDIYQALLQLGQEDQNTKEFIYQILSQHGPLGLVATYDVSQGPVYGFADLQANQDSYGDLVQFKTQSGKQVTLLILGKGSVPEDASLDQIRLDLTQMMEE